MTPNAERAGHTYEYPHPAVTVDCVVFGLDEADDLKVLLIERKVPPFEGRWALPGGFVRIDEDLDTAARRELKEETSLDGVYLEQLYTFGKVRRDPRERVISVGYFALVNLIDHPVQAATDAKDAKWWPVVDVQARSPKLAFDHAEILDAALNRLKGKVRYEPIGFELLPKKFTLSQLQRLYESILERPLDKRNFRKKILGTGLLIELDEIQQGPAGRAAKLHRFDEAKYERMKRKGIGFEI
jgi:8-oxo-dGTP diphosphatase